MRGDKTASDKIIKILTRTLRWAATSYARDDAMADDFTQIAIIHIWKQLVKKKWKPSRCSFAVWAYRVATWKYRDLLRKEKSIQRAEYKGKKVGNLVM